MKKIIICTVSIGIVLVLGITALVMALVPVGQNNFITKPAEIYLLNATTLKNESGNGVSFRSGYNDAEESEGLKNIYKVFNECFSQKALTALFRGELGDKVKTHYESTTSGNSKTIARNGDSTHLTFLFAYSEPQTIKVDGKDAYEYKYLFFQIDNSSERQEVRFAVSNSNLTDSYTSNNIYYNYWFSAKMNTAKLYDYISGQKYTVEGKSTQIIDTRA